jgi:deoxyribodipyrimidine photo-lyase
VVLFWFRRDLRLSDNAGLFRALELGIPVQPVFIFDRSILDRLEDHTDARVQFIHGEVERLRDELQSLGANLWCGYGIPEDIHRQWILDHPEIQGVFANRDYEPYARERDARIEALYREGDRWFKGAKDHVVFEKSEVVKPDGLPYTVYTPYSRRWRAALEANGVPSYPSERLLDQGLRKSGPQNQVPSLESMGFAPSSISMPPKTWSHDTLVHYAQRRDIPSDEQGTTRLGLHLRFGTFERAKRRVKPLSTS